MQETDKLKLRKPEYNEYADIADINHNMNILDNAVSDKLGKTEKAVDSDKLNGLNFLQFARSYSLSNGETIPRDVLRTTNIANAYIGMINYGTEDGLPCPHSKIIYMPHNTDGYGSQIAIPYESGNYHGVFYRNATGGNWGAWIELLDTRDRNTILTNDANTCFETGKAYYCVYQQTKNLPLGDNTDDGIIIPYMHIKGQYGFQIYMTWNGASIWWRRVINGNWDGWRCIGGGSWNQEILKDSSQV
ncbi:pyocin knob domain-containing protein, partial [Peptoanaerobacter stomatis]|uniref:pyocin knob domain-containing protein n=1 Tax=Peptoanaerobacter stomatis TaxID=796937 RepID=UPI003FA0E9B3